MNIITSAAVGLALALAPINNHAAAANGTWLQMRFLDDESAVTVTLQSVIALPTTTAAAGPPTRLAWQGAGFDPGDRDLDW
jgi:hypothetical protein